MIATEYINLCIKYANKAAFKGDVPVGALATLDDKIIATAYNQVFAKSNPTQHAELVLIQKLSRIFKKHRFDDHNISIYITLEPCRMCSSLIALSRIKKVYFGILEPKFGGLVSNPDERYHIPHVYYGFCETEIQNMMRTFFENKR